MAHAHHRRSTLTSNYVFIVTANSETASNFLTAQIKPGFMWTVIIKWCNPWWACIDGLTCVCARVRVICAFLVLELSFLQSMATLRKMVLESVKMRHWTWRDWNIVFLDKNVFEQHKAGWADGDHGVSVCSGAVSLLSVFRWWGGGKERKRTWIAEKT